ncbi:uncharacterized protein [Palaemon carinicauda]|uniref:uncharacterized protein n=1 Tax=Palaemon carinicauda TaxID=392227 RepID=UPI0035B5C224
MIDFSVYEAEAIIKQQKRWKAPGYDGITAKGILAENEVTYGLFTRSFCKMWHKEAKPGECHLRMVVKIAKGEDLTDCKNYRTITLMSVVLKTYRMVIRKRLERKTAEKLMTKQDLGKIEVALTRLSFLDMYSDV